MPKIEVIDGKTPEELAAEAALAEHDGEVEGEEEEAEEQEAADAEEQAEAVEGAEEEETIVSIGDEPVEEAAQRHTAAPDWVKDLRRKVRDLSRRNRELEDRVGNPAIPQKIQVGKKPTLEGCDYDAERFERELADWYATKAKADQQEADEKKQAEAQNKAWQEKMNGYEKAKTSLKVSDFEDAEQAVQESLSVTQQGIILSGVENAALMIYALGKNPAKLKELASITDPVKFAFATAKLEPQLKTTTRSKPAPERRVTGSGPTSGVVTGELERLRAEAEKTGDYTKVLAYKRQQKQKRA